MSPRSPIPPRVAALGWFAGWFLGTLVVGSVLLSLFDTGEGPLAPWQLAVMVGSGWTIFVALLWMMSNAVGTTSLIADYGLRFRPIDLTGIIVGGAVQLAIVPVTYLALRSIWPDTFSDEAVSKRASELVSGASGLNLVLLVLVIVIGAPVVEELVYRGLLQRSFAAHIHPVMAWIGVSILFAVIHFSAVEIPGLVLAGLAFGAWPLITGRIGGAIWTHVGFNAAGLVIALGS
ncbi:MAG: hypothetical protein CSA55_06185 [Ilumatobacter coccineus]|uniref:CAAX prenyl protease 2/Lysostaphin resistance protein A-like domain-containing protein n=1 Tax=Ilumatobacter coccineus TaxID=467094 RepID=A0A2G6K691_9ACTN|nr:MAG: hypothetical protein CSA55_06185 [Ilumatobacter coccineus]